MSVTVPYYPIILYDGECALCNHYVQWVLKYDHRAQFCFSPLQGKFAEEAQTRHPLIAQISSIVVLDIDLNGTEQIWLRSAAVLRIIYYLGGYWRLLLVFQLIPVIIRDRIYDFIARYRYHLFGKRSPQCMVVPANSAKRFVP
jgi:predicted DCC family thiol-disulfide oxidoreductase YuxK